MSFVDRIKSKQVQKQANDFIKLIKGKSDKEIEQIYLDNKDLETNEIALSHLFFNNPSLIRIMPVDFQKSRLNSNLSMFKYGSQEAKKSLVSDWLKDNKFFINCNSININDEEYKEYLKIYFQQPDDIAKLHMEDLRNVIDTLNKIDSIQTDKVIEVSKDKFTPRQWEFIIDVNPSFIKYAPQEVQNKYSDDEKYSRFISGEARNKYLSTQIEKVREDINVLKDMDLDVKKEYINMFPYMINYIDEDSLIELVKDDISLIGSINIVSLRSDEDRTLRFINALLENIESKSNKEIVNILVSNGLLNAKGKVYRYDKNSENTIYQYTKRTIRTIQKLSIDQIRLLINIDVNYVIPYLIPLYKETESREKKESIIIDSDSRCLKLFKTIYGDETYENYYKVINRIYKDYITNLDSYYYETDYECLFELFKILFNKNIILNNSKDKIMTFIGMSLLYKNNMTETQKQTLISLLNEFLTNSYNRKINNTLDLYSLQSLEIFDQRLSFIDEKLLMDFNQYNFTNISNLLLICKQTYDRGIFKFYLDLLISIYGSNKETLFRASEYYKYNRDLLVDVCKNNLSDKELKNFINLIASYTNDLKMKNKNELINYDVQSLKLLIRELSSTKDEEAYKNLLSNYLFAKGYTKKGNIGFLEVDTIEQLINSFDAESLETLKINDEYVFSNTEIDLFKMINLLFKSKNLDILFTSLEELITSKTERNLPNINILFNKLKKYKIDLINNQIVGIKDLEDLYQTNPDIISKINKDGVTVYRIKGQDFKVISSINDDGLHYNFTSVTKLNKNEYGYNKLIKSGSIRFTTYEDKTIIKFNKDRIKTKDMKPSFLIITGLLTQELINIAKNNKISILEVIKE